MADYSALRDTINNNIVPNNGRQEITGAKLNSVLNSMVDVLGDGYTFLGVATISTNPTTPEGKAYYLAGAAGTYSNFGNIVVNDDEVALLVWNGTAWSKVVTGAASKEVVNKKADNVTYYLDGDSYIYNNSIYIDRLVIYKRGVVGRSFSIQNLFVVNSRYFLIANHETGNVRIAGQEDVNSDEDILLISGGYQKGFFYTGKLFGYKFTQKWYNVPLSVAQYNKAISYAGELVTASGYSLSAPIYIESGTLIAVQIGGYYVTALAKVEDNNYTPIVTYENDGIGLPRAKFVTIQDSGYYVISSSNFELFASLATNVEINVDDSLVHYLISDTLVAGAVWSSSSAQKGEVYQPCDGSQKKFFLSQRFLSVNGKTDIINSINGGNGLPLYLLQYDENYHLIGNVSVTTDLTLSENCRYVKVCLGDATEKDYSQVFITFDISAEECPMWSYNGPNDFTATPKVLFRTYELTEPYITDNCTDSEITASYRGIQSRRFNWGYIVLPKNYSRTGKPSPVIIHCHGTSGVVFNQQSLPYNTRYLEFLAKCGYAVIGCSTLSDKYANARDDGDFPSPLAHSCYYNLWKYMTSEFNLDKTGAYIFGYSAGGMNTILLTQSKQIPIKAAAVLAGSVDLFCNMRILADYVNERFFELVGLPNTDLPTGLATDGIRMHVIDPSVKALILANKDKFTGRNPFNFNSDLDYWTFFDRYADVNNYTTQLINDTTLNEIIDGARTYFNTPIKIWHAVDDSNVPIQMSRWWRELVMNGGGLCYLREFPAGCGAHYAVGYTGDESLTPMVDYLTPFNETANIPVAYAEMVDWFNRY